MAIREHITSDAWIDFGSLPQEIAFTSEEFDELWNKHPEELGKIKLFGNIIDTPRYQVSYLQPYFFTGMDHPANGDLPYLVIRLLNWINESLPYGNFNQVFINWYKDGTHYIGPHFDKVKQLIPDAPIFSVSLGTTRIFELSDPRNKNNIIKAYPMVNNSYLVMSGQLNRTYKHGVPPIKPHSVALTTDRRINITFRIFKTSIPREIKEKLINTTIVKHTATKKRIIVLKKKSKNNS